MKKIHAIFIVAALIVLSSCNPKVITKISKTHPALDYKQDVYVIDLDQAEPEDSEVLGYIKIGDTGFSTKCDYDIVIDKAKLEARKAGGNAIKITEHKLPSAMGSSCHRIKATILKIDDIENFKPELIEELLDVDYAILNIYRPSGAGALVGYDLYLGDSVICRVKNNYKTTVHIKKDGLNSLWAKTETKTEVPINIILGKTYYLRCGVTTGLMVGRPSLELISGSMAKKEFESIKTKKQ
jgi:hypothetical protein